MSRPKVRSMTFNLINPTFFNDANEGFGQSSTSRTSLQYITQRMFLRFEKISDPAYLEIYFKLELAIKLHCLLCNRLVDIAS